MPGLVLSSKIRLTMPQVSSLEPSIDAPPTQAVDEGVDGHRESASTWLRVADTDADRGRYLHVG